MFSAYKLCKIPTPVINQVRLKSKDHWSKLRKKIGPKYKALNHFDDFYGSVFGNQWDSIREALLMKSKYVALVNNFGDSEKTEEYLTSRGAHCLKKLLKIQEEFDSQFKKPNVVNESKIDDKVDKYLSKVQNEDIDSVYSGTDQRPDRIDTADITLGNNDLEIKESKRKNITPNRSTLTKALAEAEIDESRIIDPSLGLTSEALYQYIPATKLKGMDEWVPESLHYSYYSKAKDFPLIIEPETEFSFPEHLKVYTYEMDSDYTTFSEPKRCQTGVYNYYPMDGGSVAVVLALCLKGGERVLDLCAAPGGKSLVALQTFFPEILVSNDISISRSNRIQHIFKDYLYDFEISNKWQERVILTRVDGTVYQDEQGFDCVIVDVPCTTDRHSLKENENNIFRPDRIKERLKLPELQSRLLVNALTLVKVGGSVVYSTCSLSPIQNDGVVHMSLKQAFESHDVTAVVKDLTSCMSVFSNCMHFASGVAAPKYGQLILPHAGANFGPTYFSKLVRTK